MRGVLAPHVFDALVQKIDRLENSMMENSMTTRHECDPKYLEYSRFSTILSGSVNAIEARLTDVERNLVENAQTVADFSTWVKGAIQDGFALQCTSSNHAKDTVDVTLEDRLLTSISQATTQQILNYSK